MTISWYKLLDSLGVRPLALDTNIKHSCPMHPGTTPSLEIVGTEGFCEFNCIAPECLFHGDSIALVSTARNISPYLAVNSLCAGGDLDHVVDNPLKYTKSSEDYVRRINDAYKAKCTHAFRTSPELTQLRIGLTRGSLNLIPRQIGFVPDSISCGIRTTGEDILFEDRGGNIKGRRQVIFPYTYFGRTTFIKGYSVDEDNKTLWHSSVDPEREFGVFMEENIGMNCHPSDLLVTFDPRLAVIIYGEFAAVWAERIPVISLCGMPMPVKSVATSLKRLHFVETTDFQLPYTDVLKLFAYVRKNPQTVALDKMYVLSTNQSSDIVSYELFDAYLRKPDDTKYVSLIDWLIRRLNDVVFNEGEQKLIMDLKDIAFESHEDCKVLTDRALELKALPALIRILSNAYTNFSTRLHLSDTRSIQDSAAGLQLVVKSLGKNTYTQLTNFRLKVLHRLLTKNGENIFTCKATLDTDKYAPVEFNLRESDLSGDRIRRAVITAFAERRESPYVTVCFDSKINWNDVLFKLGEGCEIRTEIFELGVGANDEFNFPKAVIKPLTNEIVTQQPLLAISDATRRLYAGLSKSSCTEEQAISLYRSLFDKTDNFYLAGFVLGLSHVIHKMTTAYQSRHFNMAFPRHLFFVESQTGIWEPIFSQLSFLFSGQDEVMKLPSGKLAHLMNSFSDVGHLPIICNLTDIGKCGIADILPTTQRSLLCTADSIIAQAIPTSERTSFITSVPKDQVDRYVLDYQDLLSLQKSALAFFSYVLRNIDASASAYKLAMCPSAAAYTEVCRLLDVHPKTTTIQAVKSYYDGIDAACVDLMFHMMYRMYSFATTSHKLYITYGSAKKTGREHAIVLDDCVLINKELINVLNRILKTGRFNLTSISAELADRGFNTRPPEDLKLDLNRYWVISRSIWEEYVIRTPIDLSNVTPSIQDVKQIRIGA